MKKQKEPKIWTHDDLVTIAHRWVLNNASCGVAFKEISTTNTTGEIPDVIGFGSWGLSVLIECKASRSDFLCDKHKTFRKEPHKGMGTMRYYCCPTGMIKKEELPERWGLVYVSESGRATMVQDAYNPRVEPADDPYDTIRYERGKNILAEHAFMYSILRRLQFKGVLKYHELRHDEMPDESELPLFQKTADIHGQ